MSGCGGCGQKREALKLARQLELEHGCERCHTAPATEIFDNRFVCSPCRIEMEKELVKHG